MPSAHKSAGKDSKTMPTSSKPVSLSIGSRLPAGSSRKRLHSTLVGDSDSDDDKNAGPQLLSGFDRVTGKAITDSQRDEEKQPLVITQQKNQDWRTEAAKKRGKNLLPAEEQVRRAGQGPQEEGGADEEEKPVYGLLVTKRPAADEANGNAVAARSVAQPSSETKTKTADEEAMDALLGNHTTSSNLVIPNASTSSNAFASRQSEGEMFKSDVDARPDVPSLADYAAVPIEEFGKALLRGMGWKEGEELGRAKGAGGKTREVKRRPALLGIGAKEAPEGLEELGAWGKGAKKSRRIDTSYMPLVMQNSKTGEQLTEEELTKKNQRNTLVMEDQERHRDSESHSERRHRDRDDRNRNSSNSRRRDRDRSPSRRLRTDEDRDRDRDRKGHRDDHDGNSRRRDRVSDSRRHDDEERRRRRHEEPDNRERDRQRHRDRDRRR
jgi:G-patch domain